jgi:hypothetical protein
VFELDPPTITLQIAPDAGRGGLASWGRGDLEVQVRGDVSLARFFELVDRLGNAARTESQSESMRSAFGDFAQLIVGWNIKGLEATPENFATLPYPLCVAIFTAWAKAASLDPTSSAA